MNRRQYAGESHAVYLLILLLLGAFVMGVKWVGIGMDTPADGWINLALGGMLLAAFVIARLVRTLGLPMLSGYIFAGILAGPFVSGFLCAETVDQLKLIDELALSVIALAAGAELQLAVMKKRGWAIFLHILLITVFVLALVVGFVFFFASFFDVTAGFSTVQLAAFAVLIGVISVARSPSSTIAIISECRASGRFTETVLGVTLLTDILVIIMFTSALAVSRQLLFAGGGMQWNTAVALGWEIIISLAIGALLGKGISLYIRRVKFDFLIFLIFIAFAVSRASIGFNEYMAENAQMSLHLEPLLICMSAGFFIRNFTGQGGYFMESLDRIALPVYVLFFSLAGAALDFGSLILCWPLAVGLVLARAAGLFAGSWAAGRVLGDPKDYQYCAWMTYLTQAGVAIGLAQLAMGEFPEIGNHLHTVVLAVIAINQIAGPVLFKVALHRVNESGRSRHGPV
ncbi:MAG: cation:proton antiporter [Desulfobacterales bacterium]